VASATVYRPISSADSHSGFKCGRERERTGVSMMSEWTRAPCDSAASTSFIMRCAAAMMEMAPEPGTGPCAAPPLSIT
jgi:hypothetical protein